MIENTPCTTSIRATRKSSIFRVEKLHLLSFLSKNPGVFIYFSDQKYIDWKSNWENEEKKKMSEKKLINQLNK